LLDLLFNPEEGGCIFLSNADLLAVCFMLFLIHLLFNPEDRGDMFLQNIN
jgi:hypothetical protein